jgi:hypothetical protein
VSDWLVDTSALVRLASSPDAAIWAERITGAWESIGRRADATGQQVERLALA